MNIAHRMPGMTRDEFLDWVERQDVPYEFDGFRPVAMNGGTRDHFRISLNIYSALRTRLVGSPCEPLGLGAGIATVGKAVRYPDVFVTCTAGPGADRLIPGVVAVFEVISPTSGSTDRTEKVREYFAVPTIQTYVIVEQSILGLTVFKRVEDAAEWKPLILTADDTLRLPEIGVGLPVREFYSGTDIAADSAGYTSRPLP